MRRENPNRRGIVNWLKEYLAKEYRKGNNPPNGIDEWKQRFFQKYLYQEVYNLIHIASDELAMESRGRIQFVHNIFEDKWRFHEGLDDYLMIHYGTEARINGHMGRQNRNWGYSQILVPDIKEEITLNDVPMLAVSGHTVIELKRKYTPSRQ